MTKKLSRSQGSLHWSRLISQCAKIQSVVSPNNLVRSPKRKSRKQLEDHRFTKIKLFPCHLQNH